MEGVWYRYLYRKDPGQRKEREQDSEMLPEALPPPPGTPQPVACGKLDGCVYSLSETKKGASPASLTGRK